MRSTLNIHDIVLADDDIDHSLIFQKIINDVDPQKAVTVFNNGNELLEFLSATTPNLLFLDLNMPCKNGFDCLKEIKRMPHLTNMKIVVYSNSSQMNDIHQSYFFKADLYMVKPFSVEQLKLALKNVLNLQWHPSPQFYYINNKFVPYTF